MKTKSIKYPSSNWLILVIPYCLGQEFNQASQETTTVCVSENQSTIDIVLLEW